MSLKGVIVDYERDLKNPKPREHQVRFNACITVECFYVSFSIEVEDGNIKRQLL
jgi:hypothetical protein